MAIVQVYVSLIKTGIKEIDQVPDAIRQQVQDILTVQ